MDNKNQNISWHPMCLMLFKTLSPDRHRRMSANAHHAASPLLPPSKMTIQCCRIPGSCAPSRRVVLYDELCLKHCRHPYNLMFIYDSTVNLF